MKEVLARWNALDPASAAEEVLPCCGSAAWAERLAVERPFADGRSLLSASGRIWLALGECDWRQAFDSHPRLGERHAHGPLGTRARALSLASSAEEQRAAVSSGAAGLESLRRGNALYEERFGQIFIVCARGRSAQEILELLRERMKNDPAAELHAAAEQQRQITELRLERWLAGS